VAHLDARVVWFASAALAAAVAECLGADRHLRPSEVHPTVPVTLSHGYSLHAVLPLWG
jgi:hypothetical protein